MSKPILEEKDILNPNEAIELFVLSRRKFYKLLKDFRNTWISIGFSGGENPFGPMGNTSLSTM